jgi:hypothetical protein
MIHKISKQVQKLPPALRDLVEGYISEKLDDLMRFLERDMHYEDNARLLLLSRSNDSYSSSSKSSKNKKKTKMNKRNNNYTEEDTGERVVVNVVDEQVRYIRVSRVMNYMSIFHIFMEHIARTFLMDVYLLSRMLYYTTHPESKHGTCIVYAGDYHISVYADFMTRYMRLRPLGHHSTPTDKLHAADVQRCVELLLQQNKK